MKIKYLGTGAAEGFPAIFCKCRYCEEARRIGFSEFRTRTQVYIDDTVCIDFPPEAYSNYLRAGINLPDLSYLLVTHSHMDHFYAHDFILRGYKYAQVKGVLNIYGNIEVCKVFAECTRREMKEQVMPNLSVNEIKPYMEFELGGYRVITLPAAHSNVEDAILYYIEKDGAGYLHFYDTGRVSDEVFAFLAEKRVRVALTSFDCTFADRTLGYGVRHMGIGDVAAMRDKLYDFGVAASDMKSVITHFSHNGNPLRSNLAKIEKEYNVIAAYDGMQLEI